MFTSVQEFRQKQKPNKIIHHSLPSAPSIKNLSFHLLYDPFVWVSIHFLFLRSIKQKQPMQSKLELFPNCKRSCRLPHLVIYRNSQRTISPREQVCSNKNWSYKNWLPMISLGCFPTIYSLAFSSCSSNTPLMFLLRAWQLLLLCLNILPLDFYLASSINFFKTFSNLSSVKLSLLLYLLAQPPKYLADPAGPLFPTI